MAFVLHCIAGRAGYAVHNSSISKHISFSAVSYTANTFLRLPTSGAPINYSNLHKIFKQLQHGSEGISRCISVAFSTASQVTYMGCI